MSVFELWINSFTGSDTELWELGRRTGETGLYMTKQKYLSGNNYFYHTVYHVWEDGKWIVATTNRDDAYAAWNMVRNSKGMKRNILTI